MAGCGQVPLTAGASPADTSPTSSAANGATSGAASVSDPATAAAVTLALTASSTQVVAGNPVILEWSSQGATACDASGGWSGAMATSGTQSVTVKVDTNYALMCSGYGGSATQSITVSVASPAAATSTVGPLAISGSPPTSVQAGTAYNFLPSISGGGSTLAFSIQNKPAWATFSVATGQLAGTPTAADAGTDTNISISVNDGTTTATLPSFSIAVAASSGTTVSAANGSATVLWTAPTENVNGTVLTDLSGFHIYYGTQPGALTQSVSLANPAQTSYTIQGLAPGTWYFAVAADASDGTESALSAVTSKTI